MKILINCGDCARLGKPEPGEEHGFCAVVKQHRHAKRELCPEVWLKETARVAAAVHREMDEVKHLGMSLDPKRTWEAVGVTEFMLPSEVKTIKPKAKGKKAQNVPKRKKAKQSD